MKNLSFILAVLFSLTLLFNACTKNEVVPEDDNIIPESFVVDIPSALMSDTKTQKSTKDAVLNGNVIYLNLTTFIVVGYEAAQIVSDIIESIRLYNLSQPLTFTYTSEEDGRDKNVVIIENSEYEGKIWQYQMTITDADSEGNEDGGIAIQVFWDKNPVDGIALLKPYNIDRTGYLPVFEESMVRLDYSETGANYEQEMTVYISGLKLANPLVNPYSMETLKMNVGKDGNVIEVYGNSNHPNAILFGENTGFNWAFVAAGSNVSDIAVAEVGLPSSDLNSANRKVILEDNSIKNVFTSEIYAKWPDLPQDQVDAYLQNTEAPGYFNSRGFVQGGTSPGPEYDVFETAINGLTPYNPIEVSNLEIVFKTE